MAPLRTNQIGNHLNMTFKSNRPYFKFHHIWCFFTGYSAVFLKRTHFSSQTNQTLGVQKCVGTDMCCMDYLPLKKTLLLWSWGLFILLCFFIEEILLQFSMSYCMPPHQLLAWSKHTGEYYGASPLPCWHPQNPFNTSEVKHKWE